MPIALTTTYWKIKEMTKPIKLIQGGQGAGKNISLEMLILDDRPKARVTTILTDTYPNLKDGPIADFEFLFKEWGLEFSKYFNKSSMNLSWEGRTIQFRHADHNKPFKGKGPRRQLLYINEGNRLGWAGVEHYIARSEEVIVDFNPDFEFWAHTELEPREDCEKIIVTYKDNEMCPPNEVRYIESRKHLTEWYRVYGEGLTGTYSERRIYTYSIIKEIPEGVKKVPFGMDFGQSPDPSCLVEVYINGIDLYLHQVFEENNLMLEKIKGADRDSVVDRRDDIIMKEIRKKFPDAVIDKPTYYYMGYKEYAEEIKEFVPSPEDEMIKLEIRKLKNHLTIGDSAGKRELLDMNRHGYNVRGVKKKTGSIKDGIKLLRSFNIHVTESSTSIIEGMNGWFWKLDHNGKIVPEPDGHEPHTLAAARYVMLAKNAW